MQGILVWVVSTLFIVGKAESERDIDFETRLYSPRPDVCQPGPKGGIEWILHVRGADYGWKEHTHRAIIALAVNDYPGDDDEKRKMELQLEVEITRALFRNKTSLIHDSDLALYIHALLATNKNPRNFHGSDLVADLAHRVETAPGPVNPFLVLALCNSHAVQEKHVKKILEIANRSHAETSRHPDVDSREAQLKALAFKAFICASDTELDFSAEIRTIIDCLRRKYNKTDGSFGNVYTTSLAVQAFTANKEEFYRSLDWWDESKSLAYLRRESEIDVNLIKAYYIEMALTAQKWRFIKNMYDGVPRPAPESTEAQTHYVQYTIKTSHSPDIYPSITLKVPYGKSFYEIMEVASNVSDAFNFTAYQNNDGEPMVYSVAGIPNDVEENMFWRICRQTDVNHNRHASKITAYDESPSRLIPKEDEHLIYLYTNTECPKM